MFLNEGEKENFLITERVLESSKKNKNKKKREGVGERKSSWNVLNEGEKESKRGGRDSGQCVEEKKKKKKKAIKRMVESEMKKGKII